MSDLIVSGDGTARWQGKEYRCAVGQGGVVSDKREGDLCTPIGRFLLRSVLYRADRLDPPASPYPTRSIARRDVWCEEPEHACYNRMVTADTHPDNDRLWRDDHIYDVLVVIGYNDDPPEPGKGSAIFLHLARRQFTPTHGCVALSLPDLLDFLGSADANTMLVVAAERAIHH